MPSPESSSSPPRPGDSWDGAALLRRAIRLIYLGAALALIAGVVRLVGMDWGELITTGIPGQAVSSEQLDEARSSFIGISMTSTVVECALWWWMAVKCGQGRRWARVVSTVFFGVGVIAALYSLSEFDLSPYGLVIQYLSLACGGAAVLTLWRRELNAYFQPA